jgi:hypothetical protein
MARATYFQRNAETCLAGVAQARDAADRAAWRARAERWLQLAREAEAKADDEPLNPGTPLLPADPPPEEAPDLHPIGHPHGRIRPA